MQDTRPTLRIQLWSGPRNVSTALMYSFAQRPDTRVVDEPLYAHYLRVSGAEHPGKAEVLRSQEQDGEKVVRDVARGLAFGSGRVPGREAAGVDDVDEGLSQRHSVHFAPPRTSHAIATTE